MTTVVNTVTNWTGVIVAKAHEVQGEIENVLVVSKMLIKEAIELE